MGGLNSGKPRIRALRVPKKYAPGLLGRGDGRARAVRDLRKRFADVVMDLGGPAELSALELQHIERLAHASYWCARIEEAAREKGAAVLPPALLQQYMACAHLAIRLSDALGLKRRTKRAPSLQEYMAAASPTSGGSP